jgi:hypothetical protein
MTACGNATSHASSDNSGHTDASGCAIGHLHLSAAPATTPPSATLMLTATAVPGNDFVIEDVGTVGTMTGTQYRPLWDITLDARGRSSSDDVEVTGATAVQQNEHIANGVFSIEVPPLSKGTHQVRFCLGHPAGRNAAEWPARGQLHPVRPAVGYLTAGAAGHETGESACPLKSHVAVGSVCGSASPNSSSAGSAIRLGRLAGS